MKSRLSVMMFGAYGGLVRGWLVGGMVMIKRVAVTISVVGGVMLAIALAPNVPTALATAHTTITTKDKTLNQRPVDGPCVAFEAWFLDPACSKPHAKKAARAKHHREG